MSPILMSNMDPYSQFLPRDALPLESHTGPKDVPLVGDIQRIVLCYIS